MAFLLTDMTIRSVEHFTFNADGSLFDQQSDPRMANQKMGGTSRTVGVGSCVMSPTDPGGLRDTNLLRPTAAMYRAKLEYTFDTGSPAGVHVLTVEQPIVSKIPPRPIMTSLAITTQLTGDPPELRGNKPTTFVAVGGGGTPPYQFQWRVANTVLRDWSPDATFTWNGILPGAPNISAFHSVTLFAVFVHDASRPVAIMTPARSPQF
jgi:hypothetical protein